MPFDRWPDTGFDPSPLLEPGPDGRAAALARPRLAWFGVLVPILFAAVAYMALRPPSVDLAAQLFRCKLFASDGFLTWNNYWYGGHYLLGYSVLFPPLGAAVGARAVGGLAAVVATGLFGLLARHRYGPRAPLATLWFGSGIVAMLLSGRLTFVLGAAVGLAALVALDRERPLLAFPLAVATSFSSPVAGFFLVLIGGALILSGGRRRGAGLALAAGVPAVGLALAFPTSGSEPFAFSSLAGTLAFTLLVYVALPRRERLLRYGTALYAGAVVCIFAVPNALGGNVVRLSNLAAASVLALGLAGPRRRLALAVLALPLLYWQWHGAIRDVSGASADPSVQRSFYTSLLGVLKERTGGLPVRIEIPPTRDRWEVYYVAPKFLLARGWERQQETDELHFRTNLAPASYRGWLEGEGVSYVALPRAPLDYLVRREAALIRGGLPYLDQVWSNHDWRLYAVRDSKGLIDPPASLSSIGADWYDLQAPRAGSFLLRIHFNPYWIVSGSGTCLREKGSWTVVETDRPGSIHVGTDFSTAALLGRHRVCSDED